MVREDNFSTHFWEMKIISTEKDGGKTPWKWYVKRPTVEKKSYEKNQKDFHINTASEKRRVFVMKAGVRSCKLKGLIK